MEQVRVADLFYISSLKLWMKVDRNIIFHI